MAGTGETVQTVWVLYEHADDVGNTTCVVMKVFGNIDAAIDEYVKMTRAGEALQAQARETLERGEFHLEFLFEGAEYGIGPVPFVGPMSGGRSRRRRITRRNNPLHRNVRRHNVK
jgi:hypothetical protein